MKQTKLYNIILPIWLLILLPQVWLITIPGNLIIDCAVLLLALLALKHPQKKAVLKKLWWRFWLLGFAADAVGVVWMFLPALAEYVISNPFKHPAAFVWTLIGVALAGVCIYFFDKRAMRSCTLLTGRQKHIIALTMAIVTAPWLFFIPMY
ncbi:MAG: hypothetical protein ACI3XJ_08395 [Oscillospiraceae bacterium]